MGEELKILKGTRFIIFFSYLLIICIVVYISYKLYQNKRKPLAISSQTYALFDTKSELPENTFLDLNSSSYDKIKQETDVINSFKYCDPGQYVLDIKTGIKRGPAEQNTKMLFNPTFELCTAPYLCPPSQPFAVQSSGETKTGVCEEGIPCRCINEKYCGPYVSQVLEITNGNPWVNDSSLKNFSITALSSGNEDGFTLDPLVISKENSPTQYCKINPEYTQWMENGCVFNINSGEPMDCTNGSYFGTNTNITAYVLYAQYSDETIGAKIIKWNYKDFNLKTSDRQIKIFNGYDKEPSWVKNLPLSGTFELNSSVRFSYKGVTEYNPGVVSATRKDITTDYDTDTLYTPSYTILHNITTNGIPGLSQEMVDAGPTEGDFVSGNRNKTATITLTSYNFQGCVKTNLPDDNYKNMLNCVQEDSQPCITGQLAYNVDKGEPRDFAQFNNGTGTPPRKLDNYLLDPSIYTMSCVNGGGCSKIIDLTLCENNSDNSTNCIPAYSEKKTRFYSEVDDSAIASQWVLDNENHINGFSERFQIKSRNPFSITFNTNNSMLTLENGDYWSLFASTITSFSSTTVKPGSKIFKLNDVTGITEGMCVSYGGMCSLYNNSVKSVSSDKTVHLTSESYLGVCYGDEFSFYNILENNQYGLITECNTDVNGIQTCTLKDLSGKNDLSMGTSPIINIYKQFGFNGINYNTEINIFNTKSNGFRNYTKNSIINVGSTDTLTTYENSIPPLSYFNFIDSANTSVTPKTFSDDFALFKNFKSMYYPIWNDNTFKQECIIPMPFLVAYPVVPAINNDTDSVTRIQIQFSGKHFSQYAYYNEQFCYNLFTPIKKASKITDLVSSNQQIVLDKPNPNIAVGNLVNDSNCNFDVYFVPVQNNALNPNSNMNSSLSTSSFPATGVSFRISIAENSMKSTTLKNMTQLDDKYKTMVYQGRSYPDSNSYIIGNGDKYSFFNNSGNKNYFLGKIYAGKVGETTYYFTMKSDTKVVNIDQFLIETNNDSNNILDNKSLIQFLDPTEILEIGFVNTINDTATGIGGIFVPSSITNGRITDIIIKNPGQKYVSDNKPQIGVTKYKIKNN